MDIDFPRENVSECAGVRVTCAQSFPPITGVDGNVLSWVHGGVLLSGMCYGFS